MALFTYLKEVKNEFRHVTWPSTRQTAAFTAIVIVFSLLVAYFLGLFDLIFTRLLDIVAF